MTKKIADQSRVPDRETCVLRNILDGYAERTPDKPYVVLTDGRQWSYRRFRDEVRQQARSLQDLGIRQGEHVIVWLPNSIDMLRLWFAINYIGAVYVPINTAYRGGILEHVVTNAGAGIMIAHGQLVPRLKDIRKVALKTVIVLGGEAEPIEGLEMLPASKLAGTDDVLPLARPIEPWDTQCIIYTSGTTGPSKGVLSSFAHLYATSISLASDRNLNQYLGADDRYMVNLPLFHVGGTSPCYTMLINGGSIALVDAFDTSTFWQTVNSTGTTCSLLLGVMATFLMKQPAAPNERQTTLRHVLVVPLTQEGVDFPGRFGVEAHTLFNMSEISCPLIADTNPKQVAACGRPRDGVEVRLVDANDCEVAQGQVGELIIRTSSPWAQNHGYNSNPEATARAWRNGWFHTGDAFRTDTEGNFYFVDRFKDAIRRRGENVSSFEVEMEVCAHPAVREAAAVAVPSEFAEDDILIAVSLVEGQAFSEAALLAFLQPRMAHFMVPRYVRVMPDLPKTPTGKIEKYLIRNAGIDGGVWDRERAGISIKREKLATGS